jgi:phytoene synthase
MQTSRQPNRPPEASLQQVQLEGSNDIVECVQILKAGSKSFAAASLLLPERVRGPAAATYAFCRVADDLIDLGIDQAAGLTILHQRLDRIYHGQPDNDPVDRAFAQTVQAFEIPKEVPLALFEGFAWDAQGRQYETLDELLAYCARVASTVGVMMTLIMGRREPEVLARASDLGLAMQLTNICRDVGEDARAGRLYLPRQLLRAEGIDPQRFLENPVASDGVGRVVGQLLAVAESLYRRADLGIATLPAECRVSIRAARLIYSDIGREIRRNGFNSVDLRAHTSKGRKLWLIFRSLGSLFWRSATTNAPPDTSTQFLIATVASRGALPAGGASL